jgi:hypothetical protein
VKFRTRRFRGNVMDVAAKSTATSPMTLFAADEDLDAEGPAAAWAFPGPRLPAPGRLRFPAACESSISRALCDMSG